MHPKSIAFVDVETSGLRPPYDRIIEIGIVRVDFIEGNIQIREFNSLVGGDQNIDQFVSELTGITAADLENAPSWNSIKYQVLELLDDAVFVAHNVRFDYGFVRNEFAKVSISFSSLHFCTVKLTRQLFPGHRSYNLDSIISMFDIKCLSRHRAFDDAKVLWDLYQILLQRIDPTILSETIQKLLGKPSVPINIDQQSLTNLPHTPGVYIFYGADGGVLYIGKSINIHDRVISHFNSDYLNTTDAKIANLIHSIESIQTAGELSALLLESKLIKQHQPLLNRRLRNCHKMVILKKSQNSNGYLEASFQVESKINVEDLDQIIGVFKSTRSCKEFLNQIAKDHNLCPKLINLEKTTSGCFNHALGKCFGACKSLESPAKYNLRFETAILNTKYKSWPFSGPIYIQEDPNKETIVIDKWCILASIKSDSDQIESVEYNFDHDTYKILYRFVFDQKNSRKIKQLKNHDLNYEEFLS